MKQITRMIKPQKSMAAAALPHAVREKKLIRHMYQILKSPVKVSIGGFFIFYYLYLGGRIVFLTVLKHLHISREE